MVNAALFSYCELDSFRNHLPLGSNSDFAKQLIGRIKVYVEAYKKGHLLPHHSSFLEYIVVKIGFVARSNTWKWKTIKQGEWKNNKEIKDFSKAIQLDLRSIKRDNDPQIAAIDSLMNAVQKNSPCKQINLGEHEKELLKDSSFTSFLNDLAYRAGKMQVCETLVKDVSFTTLTNNNRISILAKLFSKIDSVIDEVLALSDTDFKLFINEVHLSDKKALDNRIYKEIEDGHYEVVKKLLIKCVSCTAENLSINTFHVAARKGERYVKLLLNFGITPTVIIIQNLVMNYDFNFATNYFTKNEQSIIHNCTVVFKDGNKVQINLNALNKFFADSEFITTLSKEDGFDDLKTAESSETEIINLEDIKVKKAPLKEICPGILQHLTPHVLRTFTELYSGNTEFIGAINSQLHIFKEIIGYLDLRSLVWHKDGMFELVNQQTNFKSLFNLETNRPKIGTEKTWKIKNKEGEEILKVHPIVLLTYERKARDTYKECLQKDESLIVDFQEPTEYYPAYIRFLYTLSTDHITEMNEAFSVLGFAVSNQIPENLIEVLKKHKESLEALEIKKSDPLAITPAT